VALFYTDASALVKLVRDEPESPALRAFLADADVVCCEICLTEVPRAIRRAASEDPQLPLVLLLQRAGELFDALGLLAVERELLLAAGTLDETALRSLDAIHIVAAIALSPVDGFISYDERQAAAARLAGLRTLAPAG
jgi:predicted nucleic acid-binding protein